MTTRLAIDGFGRMGRAALRIIHDRGLDLDIVGVNSSATRPRWPACWRVIPFMDDSARRSPKSKEASRSTVISCASSGRPIPPSSLGGPRGRRGARAN
jgi:hypothetical protein